MFQPSDKQTESAQVKEAVSHLENRREILDALRNPFRGIRELFETLAIALFLATIFKFYEAEAYVIPTGSMATTLMGRHKDVSCQACGYRFQVSASEERDRENHATSTEVLGGTCPQCRLPPATSPFRGTGSSSTNSSEISGRSNDGM